MAKVESWFEWFAVRLTERIPRADWPAPESEFWESLRSAFVRHGVTEAVADEASKLLAEKPPRFIDQLLPELLATCKQVWASSEVAADAPSERDAAERLSRDCDDCGGVSGITARFRKLTANTLDAHGKPRGDRIMLYCRCPMGRWVERNHRTKSPDVRKRFHDLQDHPWLWGDEYRRPPEDVPQSPTVSPHPVSDLF